MCRLSIIIFIRRVYITPSYKACVEHVLLHVPCTHMSTHHTLIWLYKTGTFKQLQRKGRNDTIKFVQLRWMGLYKSVYSAILNVLQTTGTMHIAWYLQTHTSK